MRAEVRDPIKMSSNPSAISLNDKMYCFYGAGGIPWAGLIEKRLLFSVYEPAGSDWHWREGRPFDGTNLVSSPSAVVFQGRFYVFYQGPDATLRYMTLDGQETAGSEVTVKGTFLSCSPSAVVFDDKIWVAFQSREKNSEMYYVTMDKGGNFTQGVRFWHNWCSESPCLTMANGRLWCYHQGAGNDGTLNSCEWVNNEFGFSRKIDNTFLSDSPSAIIVNGKTHIFHRASGNGKRLWCDTYDMSGKPDAKWTGDIEFPDTWLQGSPCTVLFRGRIYIVHRGDDNWTMWYRSVGV